MVPPLAPIEAGAAERALFPAQRFEIDPLGNKAPTPGRGEAEPVAGRNNVPLLDQRIMQCNGHRPRKMIIADPGLTHRGIALGLFAQIGLLAHLFSLIVPALGATRAGILTGLATASAIAGRTAFGWLMPAGANRRKVAATSYAIQIVGILALILSGGQSVPAINAGTLLFGFGLGNATSLPPLIAQVEFSKEDVARVVALIIAIGQASYAFAPAVFGMIRTWSGTGGADLAAEATPVFVVAIIIKLAATSAFLWGRKGRCSG